MAEADSDQETAQPAKRRAAKRTTKRTATKKAAAQKASAKKAAAGKTVKKKATTTRTSRRKTASEQATDRPVETSAGQALGAVSQDSGSQPSISQDEPSQAPARVEKAVKKTTRRRASKKSGSTVESKQESTGASDESSQGAETTEITETPESSDSTKSVKVSQSAKKTKAATTSKGAKSSKDTERAAATEESEDTPENAKKSESVKSSAKKSRSRKTSQKKSSSRKASEPLEAHVSAEQVAASAETKQETRRETGHVQETGPTQAAGAEARSSFDRSVIVDKIRVHLLAKLIGITSRELTSLLREMGLNKVAQSTLRLEESHAVLDRLEAQNESADAAHSESESQKSKKTKGTKRSKTKDSGKAAKRSTKKKSVEPTQEKTEASATEATVAGTSAAEALAEPDENSLDAEALEKLKYRVGKNVENEIHQIEQKVDRELEARQQELEEPEDDSASDADDHASEDSQSSHEYHLDNADAFVGTPVFLAPHEVSGDSARSDRSQNSEDSENSASFEDSEQGASRRRRRGRRGTRRGRGPEARTSSSSQDSAGRGTADVDASGTETSGEEVSTSHEADTDTTENTEPVAIKGSTRLEAQRRRRTEMRQKGREKRHIVSQAEFLARRESVERIMVVRERQRHDHEGRVTQVGVLEDGVLVEHFVTSEDRSSMIGNIYVGRVQNVLPSMEAAFIDIGTGRNGVLYSGEVDWKSAGLGGRGRRIEQALHPGDQVLVQATKDPLGHKGARLSTQISLPGRYLVYVPGGHSSGISRKLPIPERKRLKEILKHVMPEDGGAIIRTAAEGVSEEAIAADVERLHTLWEDITKQSESGQNSKPVTLYEEPNVLVKVIRDLFNEDFTKLIVDGDRSWNIVNAYVQSVAPDLVDRLEKWDRDEYNGADVFEHYQINEQLQKALSRKVWLPSGGTLIIDRTEAMTVIDVNTGRFTGSGGNLEETVTSTNLEAAEEIVRQLRLRDIGGMVVIDFIDMVLPENQDLVVRRLTESLGRDRTRHQVSEVTSLGLVQLTRKRLGTGLLETFATECEECGGRGVIVHDDPVEDTSRYEKHQHHAKRRPENAAEHPLFQALKQHKKSDEELVDAVLGDLDGISEDSEDATDSLNTSDSPDAEVTESRSTSPRRKRARGKNARRESAESSEQPESAFEEQEEDTHDARPTRRRRATRRHAAHNENEAAGETAREQGHRGAHKTARGADHVTKSTTGHHDAHDSEPEGSSSKTGTSEESSAGSKRRGRRRVHRAMSSTTVSEDAPRQTMDEGTGDESNLAPGRGSRRGKRRAVRRTSLTSSAVGSRATGRARRNSERSTSGSQRSLTAEDADESLDSARREDPAVAEQRYAEEKAAFDNSPRRRRRVRGNSKSDVPPEPPRSRKR